MDQKKRLDKILGSVHQQVQNEVGTLLGVEIGVSNTRSVLVTKAEFFENLIGKQVIAKIDVAGDVEGNGCLAIGIKDAIRLGGTLIMLPDSELEEVVGREEYTEETEDSYGEIANIIAGSYSKLFEEGYPKVCRFIRKEQEVVAPAKVAIESDEPIPDQQYYQVSCSLTMGGQQMGDLHMLLPAEPFGLVEAKPKEETAEPDQKVEKAEGEKAEPTAQETESEDIDSEEVQAGDEEQSERQAPPEAQSPKKKAPDPEKHKKRVDRLLAACEGKLSNELSALLGVEIKCGNQNSSFIDKEEFFYEEVEGKQVVTDLEVVGELQGESYCVVSLKDAIHLGGVLIMLPPAELESVIAEEEFSDDLKDSYGEVSNIVAGVYTSVFEEQYPEKIRFIRKELNTVQPMKVDIESDEPFTDQKYYQSSMSLTVDGKELGRVRLLFPAVMLKLVTQDESQEQPSVEETAKVAESQPVQEDQPKAEPEEAAAAAEPPPPRPGDKGFDYDKHKKRMDRLLAECQKKMQVEVGGLLGTDIKLKGLGNKLISKEDFFYDIANGKQVMARLAVGGELEGMSFLFVALKDAIHMGGLLIMLPPTELENAVAEEEFSDDCNDAYGEIANIIAGVYSSVFEEQYIRKVRFVKKEIEKVAPMKVDIDSDEPIPDEEYYLSAMALSIGDKQLGEVNLLLPAGIFQLEQVIQEPAGDAEAEQPETQRQASEQVQKADSEQKSTTEASQSTQFDLLIVSDDAGMAGALADIAQQRGYTPRTISFQDNVRAAVTKEMKVVYIMMKSVDERAFSMIIKVNTSCSLPLIAAGPKWTRSKVIKAVKYGVSDILLTPASEEDIMENLENNLVSLAA